MTVRGAVFSVLALLLAISAINSGNNLLILILSSLIAALLVSVLASNVGLRRLHVSLQLPTRIYAGQKAVFLLRLRNLKRLLPSFAVRLRSRHRMGGTRTETELFEEAHFPYLKPLGSLELQVETAFQERGLYAMEGFEVLTGFPFGFLIRRRHLEARGTIVVYPRLLEIEDLLRRHPGLTGTTSPHRPGRGGEVHTIREYRSGDRRHAVHWKATARTGRLMVKEFLAEEEPPHGLVLCREIRGHSELPAFESAVSAVATISHFLWNARERFNFRSDEFSGTVEEREQYRELMCYLASVKSSREETRGLAGKEPGEILFDALRPWGEPRRPGRRVSLGQA